MFVSGSATIEPSSGRRVEMIEATLRLFTQGSRSLVSLASVGWAAAADPAAGTRVFGTEDELIRAAVAGHGERLLAVILTRVAAFRAVRSPPDAALIVTAFTAPIRAIERSTHGRGWVRMLVSLSPDERRHADEFVQSVVDALAPLAATRYPRASHEQITEALRSAVQMVISAVAHYAQGVAPREWLAIETFAAGGLDALLRSRK